MPATRVMAPGTEAKEPRPRVRVSSMPENLDSGPRYDLWVARNLKTLRKHLRLSQEDLGDRCHMDRTCIWRIEKEVHKTTLATAQILASALGVDLKELMMPPGEFKKSLG